MNSGALGLVMWIRKPRVDAASSIRVTSSVGVEPTASQKRGEDGCCSEASEDYGDLGGGELL